MTCREADVARLDIYRVCKSVASRGLSNIENNNQFEPVESETGTIFD
jgi:hypothetical protein